MLSVGRKWFHWLLVRRRHLDPVLLSAASAGILLPFNIGAALFGAFLASGLYLIILRPRSAAPIDPTYAIAAGVLAVGSTIIGFANGGLPGDWRWATYPIYYLGALPIAAGLCLVRDPLRQFVIGARIGIVILAIWAGMALFHDPGRYGFNANSSNTAFAIAFIAIIARLAVPAAPRFLANHSGWFYLALFPILATGTRAVLPVFLVAALIDLVVNFRGQTQSFPKNLREYRVVLPIVAVILLTAGILLAPNVQERVATTINELENLEAVPDPGKGGMTIRLTQWSLARQVIAENFWLGIGGSAVLPALLEKSPPAYRQELSRYQFSHNVILDEWMQRGLFGVVLLGGFFIFGFARIYIHGSRSMRISVILVVVLTLSFGMLHYLLLIDRHVALYGLYFMFLTTDIRRERHKAVSDLKEQ